ncbi:MAG: hypothetical protein RMJ19_14225 [Gemmatales bacterium]|nr:hypothetical protein [Gemmatales bacterium]MDW8176828.1 hypothetical protein [Gemmatales bacterium]
MVLNAIKHRESQREGQFVFGDGYGEVALNVIRHREFHRKMQFVFGDDYVEVVLDAIKHRESHREGGSLYLEVRNLDGPRHRLPPRCSLRKDY